MNKIGSFDEIFGTARDQMPSDIGRAKTPAQWQDNDKQLTTQFCGNNTDDRNDACAIYAKAAYELDQLLRPYLDSGLPPTLDPSVLDSFLALRPKAIPMLAEVMALYQHYANVPEGLPAPIRLRVEAFVHREGFACILGLTDNIPDLRDMDNRILSCIKQ